MEPVSQKMFDLWLESTLRAYSYVVGVEQLKMLISKSSEAFFMLSEAKGYGAPTGSTLPDVAKSTIELLGKIDPRKTEWTVAKTADGIGVTVNTCPFSSTCSEMFSEIISSGRIDKSRCPCIMAELVAGSARNLGIKSRTTLHSFAPGQSCVSEIAQMEM
ncbi:MAG: hypothetical protein GX421_03950 [Caldisericales bacterium]|nr:hypothetical protein [Caldisericales bacterium]